MRGGRGTSTLASRFETVGNTCGLTHAAMRAVNNVRFSHIYALRTKRLCLFRAYGERRRR
ncbi:MAG: hypothetical protein AAF298_07570 [Cyanobacteria bacterium P01_A01_bin.40]